MPSAEEGLSYFALGSRDILLSNFTQNCFLPNFIFRNISVACMISQTGAMRHCQRQQRRLRCARTAVHTIALATLLLLGLLCGLLGGPRAAAAEQERLWNRADIDSRAAQPGTVECHAVGGLFRRNNAGPLAATCTDTVCTQMGQRTTRTKAKWKTRTQYIEKVVTTRRTMVITTTEERAVSILVSVLC